MVYSHFAITSLPVQVRECCCYMLLSNLFATTIQSKNLVCDLFSLNIIGRGGRLKMTIDSPEL